jgi:hypothetical protein
MRQLVLSLITATIATFSFSTAAAAQARLSGEVQAITPCDLYSAGDAPVCPQIMIPVKSTLLAISRGANGARQTIVLRSNYDGHISASLPRTGRYRIVLRKVATSTGRFSPRALKITPNTIHVTSRPDPTLFLVSHRSRPTFNVGIAYGK